jgi:hypothetical protein
MKSSAPIFLFFLFVFILFTACDNPTASNGDEVSPLGVWELRSIIQSGYAIETPFDYILEEGESYPDSNNNGFVEDDIDDDGNDEEMIQEKFIKISNESITWYTKMTTTDLVDETSDIDFMYNSMDSTEIELVNNNIENLTYTLSDDTFTYTLIFGDDPDDSVELTYVYERTTESALSGSYDFVLSLDTIISKTQNSASGKVYPFKTTAAGIYTIELTDFTTDMYFQIYYDYFDSPFADEVNEYPDNTSETTTVTLEADTYYEILIGNNDMSHSSEYNLLITSP